jgi:hypothetical protein
MLAIDHYTSPAPREIRTMETAALDGVVGTASSLRALPRVILDLRGNSGGSDEVANQWVIAFSGGRYKGFAIANALPDGRWVSFGDDPS